MWQFVRHLEEEPRRVERAHALRRVDLVRTPVQRDRPARELRRADAGEHAHRVRAAARGVGHEPVRGIAGVALRANRLENLELRGAVAGHERGIRQRRAAGAPLREELLLDLRRPRQRVQNADVARGAEQRGVEAFEFRFRVHARTLRFGRFWPAVKGRDKKSGRGPRGAATGSPDRTGSKGA